MASHITNSHIMISSDISFWYRILLAADWLCLNTNTVHITIKESKKLRGEYNGNKRKEGIPDIQAL